MTTPLIQLTLLQRTRSLFYPLLVRREASPVNPLLELYYYRGRWQLATADALYSDGTYYKPLITAFDALKAALPAVQNVLVLGTGLGSAVQILAKRGYHPHCTLVELDKQILEWAVELMPATLRPNLNPVCADAERFFDRHGESYDLIVVDIFEGRHVPSFVLRPDFLAQCKAHLRPGGCLVLNYMITAQDGEEKPKAALSAAFDTVKTLGFHLNRVFIATA